MKVLIIFFSQTGGTEKIAEQIQKGILKNGNECEMVRIKDAKNKKLANFDLIGLGCPTFYYREPISVKLFIQKMDKVDGKHCFIFCTHGSIIGNTFYYMNEALNKKGYLVIGAYDSYSESSIQFYPQPMHTAKHPDDIELREAEEFGQKVCEISLKIKKGEKSLIPKFELIENTWWARDSKLATPEALRSISPEFKINIDKCTKCLTCQENCPVDAIDVEADPPEIQKDGCIFCWFCEKLCPEGAIEADWASTRQLFKGNLKKYIRELKKAEEQGKFRPYVDYEKIR
ncbi:MAG: 4Fe-4S binding protein [Candidatus Helarchaeota archaeon]|nr:4Fe-4S binding protein [Candidatus Helarchaeota archaeon]